MYHRILVPVAPGGADRAAEALKVAAALSADDAGVTLLTVAEPVPAYVDSYIPDEIVKENRLAMEAALKDLADAAPGKVKTALITGHAARAIVDYASAKKIDCIVIASHQPELADYFTGSNAAWVARHADCSIHVIR